MATIIANPGAKSRHDFATRAGTDAGRSIHIGTVPGYDTLDTF
jgi:hypothetical protein